MASYDAGSAVATYDLNTTKFDAAIQRAVLAYQKLRQAQEVAISRATLPAPAASAAAGGAASTRNAADDALRLAQARARLASASGDAAKAESILSTALAQSSGASERATLAVQTQVARLQSGRTVAQQFGDSFKEGLTGMIGPAAAAAAALGAVSLAIGETEAAFKLKAQLDETRQSITSLLGATRDSGQVFDEAGQFAARFGLTQAETNDILSSSVDILRTSSAGVGELEANLLRLQTRDVSKPISEAARALRELQAGDTTSIKELFNVPAHEANRMKQEIQGGADAVKVLGEFLDRAGIGMEVLDNRMQGAAGKMRELRQETENFQLALAGQAGGPGLAIMQARIETTRGAARLLAGDFDAMGQSISNAGATGQAGLAVMTGGLSLAVEEALALKSAIDPTTTSLVTNAAASDFAAVANATNAAAQLAAANAAAENAAVQSHLAEEHLAGGQALGVGTEALVAHIAQQQASELEGQRLAQVQAALASLGSAVAGGFQTAGSAALALSSQYNIAYQEALKLIQAQATLAQKQVALVALADQRAGERSGGAVRTAKEQTDLANAARNAARAQEAAAAAAARYQQQLGNFGPAIAAAQKELDNIPKGTAAFYDKLSEIDRLKNQQRAAQTKGAGSARVSAAQKVNDQLTDQEAKAQQKLEDLAAEHYKRQLDIQAEFEKRSLEQQRANEVDKRSSRASFYKTINVDNRQLSQQVREQLSAAYEEAYKKAQEIAAAGNAQQANEYLKLKQSQLEAEAQFQRDLAEARKSGDQEAVKALIAARELERQAEAEKEKQLLEGGDANVNARNEQLSEEQKRFEEAQGKAVDASDRASDRIITNAERRGVALDAENQKLRDQAAIYDQLGTRGTAPANVAAPTPPNPTTGAVPITQPSASDIWRVLDQGVIDAIGSQTTTLAGKLDATNGKLDLVIGRLGSVESAVRSIRPGALQ